MHKKKQGALLNWAGTVPLVAENSVIVPRSIAQIQEIVQNCSRLGRSIKVLGAGHSSSTIAQTRCGGGIALDLQNFQDVISATVTKDVLQCRPELVEDRNVSLGKECSITIQAGMPLWKVYNTFAKYGMRPKCPPILISQTIAGALSTGTHGHGVHSSSLSGCLLRLKAVDGTGRFVEICGGNDSFGAWQVHLGVLGILVEVTLCGTPLKGDTMFKQVHYDIPVDCETGKNSHPQSIWNALVSGEYNKVWYFPKHNRFHLFKLSETTDENPEVRLGEQPSIAATTFDWPNVHTYPWTLVPGYHLTNPLEPSNLPFSPDLGNPVVGLAFAKRIDHLLCVPDEEEMVYPQVNCELSIPFENASEAMRRISSYFEKNPDIIGDGSLVDIRPLCCLPSTTSSSFSSSTTTTESIIDQAWLATSGAGGTLNGVCYFGFLEYWPNLHRETMFNDLQELLFPLQARPHWGKRFDSKKFDFEAMYPHWEKFWKVAEQNDPKGVFRNEFVDQIRTSSSAKVLSKL